MAVVARRRRIGTVYYATVYDVDGKQQWERVGSDKRRVGEAHRSDLISARN
jgi:hypothetical protein